MNYFSKWGSIVDVEVKRDYEKNSRGFGFVLFKEAEDCARVSWLMWMIPSLVSLSP